jgi:hypothetical protein
LTYIFEERYSKLVGGWSTTLSEGKVVPFNLLHFELFYPDARVENRQTHRYGRMLAEKVATTILMELCDTSKQTCDYLSSVNGKYSAK